jgi:hypothetical protein
MKIQDRFCLIPGGKRHGNAHDRRSKPTAKERRRLARRWRRSAEDRRASLLKREAYNTWVGYLSGAPSQVIFTGVEGVTEVLPLDGVRSAWGVAHVMRNERNCALTSWGSVEASLDVVTVTARNYGVRLMFTSTPGLEWTEVVAASSNAADRMPDPYKVTGRP